MKRFLLKESTALAAEPWQDGQGNLHLPIEEAMKLEAARLAGGDTAAAAAPPNYPGAAREYAYPAAENETHEAGDTHEGGNLTDSK
jgi:hypothetical protein